jgi:hypothetical protein
VSDSNPDIRAAASMRVLRDGARGMQLLLMRRPERDNDFRSGACVFPGGVLDSSDAGAADAAQIQALRALTVAPVSWLLVTRAGDAPAAALQAQWPVAQLVCAALSGQTVTLGADSTLRPMPGRAGVLVYLLDEERVAVGQLAPAHPACAGGGLEWLAPRQVSMRRAATGHTLSA